ncbi:MAG: ribonucleoside-diphosphate reductase, adenosylcobalamin-dependent, partial [Rhodospirillales bacterium]|nr:ribonucleoside-diphosphate reductase, adenosylcobalamin-dependent [Rhodospirillales bacterium]
GGDVSFVVEELKAVFDPRGGQWMGGRYVPSLLAAIGEVIERHMIEIGFLAKPGELADPGVAELPKVVSLGAGASDDEPAPTHMPFRQCPKCAQPSLIRQEGCDTCTSCGYSKCG